jgi:hypothetical protein
MTIQTLLNQIFKANQTPNNTVNWSGVNGLKSIQQDLVEEIRQRTFLTVPSTTDLTNQGFNNAVLCYVQNGAFYRWSATGTPNGTTIFGAADGGVWIQETVGIIGGPVSGSGTANYIPKWSTTSALTNSLFYDNGTYIGIGTTTPLAKIHIKVPANNPQRGVLCLETTNVGANPFQSFWSNGLWVGYIDVSNTFFNIQSVTNGLINLNPSGGNVTVGSVTNAGYKFDVVGTFRATSTTTLGSLSGTGTRMVVADPTGILSTQAIPTGILTGSGTANYIPRWSGATALTDSILFDNGTSVGIGTNTPATYLPSTQGLIVYSAGNPSIGLATSAANTWYNYLVSTQNRLYHSTYGVVMTFVSNGNMLLGTTVDSGYKLDINGTCRISNTTTLSSLSGGGTRMVVADSTGILSTQAIPAGFVKYYGAWQDNATQTAAASNTGYGVRFNVPDITGYGVTVQADSLGNNTLIKMANAGTYNIQFSFQFENTDNAEEYVYIWLRKNGQTSAADIPASNTIITIHRKSGSTPGHAVAAWNFFVEAAANDFFQIVWATTDATHVTMPFYAATGFAPSTPSTILTVNQIN